MPTANCAATSLQMRFLIDRALAAQQDGDADVAGAFARAAETILRLAFPEIADDLSKAASRKGQGGVIGLRLAQHLDPASAAGVAIVLMLRGARGPVVDALASAFRNKPEFSETIKTLCGPVLERGGASTLAPHSQAPTSIEVGAPRGRW